nr:hypothetical protein GCM10020185_69860 [Pseudomonas brassicacearum subsp. brassicacearum]
MAARFVPLSDALDGLNGALYSETGQHWQGEDLWRAIRTIPPTEGGWARRVIRGCRRFTPNKPAFFRSLCGEGFYVRAKTGGSMAGKPCSHINILATGSVFIDPAKLNKS